MGRPLDANIGPQAVVPVQEFRAALDRDEVRLHYQPQVALAPVQVLGVEALIRWEHPSGGLLPPDDFLPALMHTPLMPRITDWVLRTACDTAVRWPELAVAVNIAATDAMRESLVESVHDALAGSGLPAARLILEVTEHSLVNDLQRATRNLKSLVDVGVRVSLDDFGTGYSSLLYLRELPITEIKIDRTFVSGMGRSRDDDAIVEGLIKLGHAVGVEVVAEGVETVAQAKLLVALGCDRAQGYLYGRPAAAVTPRLTAVADVAVSCPAVEGDDAVAARVRRRRGEPIATPEARTVIEALVAEGASLHTIAAALNRQGLRTTIGTRWVGSSVGRAIAEL